MIKRNIDIPDWLILNSHTQSISGTLAQEEVQKIPMMTARRMSKGCRAAVEVATSLMKKHSVDSLVFSSRHGELNRSEKIFSNLANNADVSPTDFSMSVHNAASAMTSIQQKFHGPVTSIAAGTDSLHSALIEALSLLDAGKKKVLVVDFESSLPEILGGALEEEARTDPYALGLVLSNGTGLNVSIEFILDETAKRNPAFSLAAGLLSPENVFQTKTDRSTITWAKL